MINQLARIYFSERSPQIRQYCQEKTRVSSRSGAAQRISRRSEKNNIAKTFSHEIVAPTGGRQHPPRSRMGSSFYILPFSYRITAAFDAAALPLIESRRVAPQDRYRRLSHRHATCGKEAFPLSECLVSRERRKKKVNGGKNEGTGDEASKGPTPSRTF